MIIFKEVLFSFRNCKNTVKVKLHDRITFHVQLLFQATIVSFSIHRATINNVLKGMLRPISCTGHMVLIRKNKSDVLHLNKI